MPLDTMVSMLREMSTPGNNSRNRELVGYWQDLKGEFFEGVIEIKADGTWKPQNLKQQKDIMASYTWRQMTSSATQWEFLQVRKHPRTERNYIVAKSGANLSVHLSGNESLRWCLERHDPERSGRIHSMAATTNNLDADNRNMREARRSSLETSFKRRTSMDVESRSIWTCLESKKFPEWLICVAVLVNSIVSGWLILAAEDIQYQFWLCFAVQIFVLVALSCALYLQALKWRDALGTGWISKIFFCIDVLMVVLGITEVILVIVLRIVPLWRVLVILECVEFLRLLRLFHLLRISKTWLHLFIDTMRWLLLSASLLLLLLYMFGVLCTRIIGHSDLFNEHPELQTPFHTLGESVFTLFSFCTFEGWTEYLRHMMRVGPYGACITVCIIAFMFVANLTIFNVAAAAMVRLQEEMVRQKQKRADKRKEKSVEHLLFQSDHQEITRDDFLDLLAPLCFTDGAFHSLEMEELFDLIDADKSGKLSREELLDGLTLLSSSSAWTKKQLFGLDKKMQKIFKSLGLECKEIAEKHSQTHKTLDVLYTMVQNLQDEMAAFLESTRGHAVADHMSTKDRSAEIQQSATCESIACVSSPSLVSATTFQNILDSFKENICAALEACLGHHAVLSNGRRADEYRQLLESVDTRLLNVVSAVHEAVETSPKKYIETCSCLTSARNGLLEAPSRITEAEWIPSLKADIHCGATPNRVAHTDVVKQDRLSSQSSDVSASTSAAGTSLHEDDTDSCLTSARNSSCEAQCRRIDAEEIPSVHAEIYCGGTPNGVALTDAPKQHRLSIQPSDVSASAPLGVAVHEVVGTYPLQHDETHACRASAPNSLCEAQYRKSNVEGSTPMQAEIHCGATQNWLTRTGVAEQHRLSTLPSDVSTCSSFGGGVQGAVMASTHKQSESHTCPTLANNSVRGAQSQTTNAGGIPSMQTEIHREATPGGVAHIDVSNQHRLATRPSDIQAPTSLGVAVFEAVETSPHQQAKEHVCPTTRNSTSVYQALSPKSDARGASQVPIPFTKLPPQQPPLVSISPANQRFTMELLGPRVHKLGEWHHNHSSKFAMTPPLRRADFVGPPRRGRTAVDLGSVSPPHIEPNGTSPAVIALAPFVGPPDSFGHNGRIAGLEKCVVEHCLSAMPFDKLVLHLDAEGVQLSTVEQDRLNYALSHRNLLNTELWP